MLRPLFKRISIPKPTIKVLPYRHYRVLHKISHKNNFLLESFHDKFWRLDILRFYADLPEHMPVPFPALSPTMETGNMASWSKKEGDKIDEGDQLCEIETDKAVMGFDSPKAGYLAKIVVPEGTKDVKLGTIICVIVDNEGDIQAFKDYKSTAMPLVTAPTVKAPPPAFKAPPPMAAVPPPGVKPPPPTHKAPPPTAVAPPAHSSSSSIFKRGRASSFELGLAKARTLRSGEVTKGSTVLRRKIKIPAGASYVDLPTPTAQKMLAPLMLHSKATIPHAYLSQNCNVNKLIGMKNRFNEQLEKKDIQLTLSDYFIKAAAKALIAFPDMNAVWLGDRMRKFTDVDLGIAYFYNGYVTPVIYQVNNKGVLQIGKETSKFEEYAIADILRAGAPSAGAMSIVNLSWLRTAELRYNIYPNQSSTLGISGTKKTIIWDEHSKKGFRVSYSMSFTLSVDHRIIDGVLAANWLKEFRGLIEEPEMMLI